MRENDYVRLGKRYRRSSTLDDTYGHIMGFRVGEDEELYVWVCCEDSVVLSVSVHDVVVVSPYSPDPSVVAILSERYGVYL